MCMTDDTKRIQPSSHLSKQVTRKWLTRNCFPRGEHIAYPFSNTGVPREWEQRGNEGSIKESNLLFFQMVVERIPNVAKEHTEDIVSQDGSP